MERRFSPLDEELGLLPGSLTPNILQHVTRLGARMPFADVTTELHALVGVDISEPTARRHAQAAGAAYVALQTAETDAIQKKMPPPPPGPDLQQVSVDGAMIPLVHKEWAEVRTVAIGVVQKPVMEKGEPVVHTKMCRTLPSRVSRIRVPGTERAATCVRSVPGTLLFNLTLPS